MNYISTRNKSLNFDFSSIFLRGLAPDGGLFLPNEIQKFNEKELKQLSALNYIDLGVEIISKFCSPILNKNKIKLILDKAYSSFDIKNIVEITNNFFEIIGNEKTSVYLKVDFKDKQEVSSLGGRWDHRKRSWYCIIPNNDKNEIKKFKKWIPQDD